MGPGAGKVWGARLPVTFLISRRPSRIGALATAGFSCYGHMAIKMAAVGWKILFFLLTACLLCGIESDNG